MRFRNPFAQSAVMIVAAMLIAVIANGFAGRTRQLKLPGWYPNALNVPPRVPEQETATATDTAPATTTVQSPGPGQPPMVIPSTTIATETIGTATTTAPPTATATTTVAATTTAPPATTPALQPAPRPAVDLSKFTPHPDKAYVEISGEDAVALHGAGALFLDARRTSIFEEGHIPGARTFSVWEADVDDKVTALYEERSDPAEQNKPIVIYCSGGACEDSHMLSQKLWGLQFNNIYVYKDGFPDWQRRNMPARKGATP